MVSDRDTRPLHAIRIERGRDRTVEDSRERGIGFCECGCGEKTRLAPQTAREKGWVRGEHLRFRLGHVARTKQRPPLAEPDYKIEDCGYETPCWIRVGAPNNKGYGKVTIAGKVQYAHRAMYEQEIGLIPEGLTLDHLCRQTMCMRPSHLEPVSFAENLRRGNGAKLTKQQVREIREVPSQVMTKTLAEQYGISQSQMSRVRRGLYWSDE